MPAAAKFAFELVVPAESRSSLNMADYKKAYEVEHRPRLIAQNIMELQNAQVEPDVWKIEGLDRREGCEKFYLLPDGADTTMSAVSS